ncbi:protein PNS1-like [Chenopodium quinoa]|uniref:protein PNS1-like n=1 Tax=Chenopodium quinoa TaxID=63459 RepID=UPI000B785EFA|nr:protein PNS1-like [Chenopodium quinoa]
MARIMSSSSVTPINNKGDKNLQVEADDLHKNPAQVEEARIAVDKPKLSGKIIGIVFYLQLLVIFVLAVILIIRGFLSKHARRRFHPSEWYPPMLMSVGLAGITGLVWQTVTYCHSSRAVKLAFWFSPLLTCAMGVLLISTGSAVGLAFGILSILVAVIQSLYACWANPRFNHAVSVLSVCTAVPPQKTISMTVVSVIVTVIYSSALVGGIGGATATGTHIDKVFIAVIILSMTWTLQVIKNILQVAVSRVRYLNFACGDETMDVWTSIRVAVGPMVGTVCFGSVLVPTVTLVCGSARAIGLIAGDSDEFLFSCTDCYSGIASRLVTCGNRWGFVHVGVYCKGIIQSSSDTWEMFRRAGMEELIDCDLTSSFCFFCGIAGGALSALAGGCWTLVVHKQYATEISIYAFLIGYLVSRVAMAWPQACASAYHVAFAENPQSARFDATIPFRLQELHKNQHSNISGGNIE